MTDVAAGGDDAYALRKVRRRGARRLMQSLTVVCVLAGAGLAADQFYAGGLQAFLDRPAGVGATPAEQAATSAATSAPLAHTVEPPAARATVAPAPPAAAPPPAPALAAVAPPGRSVGSRVRAPALKGVRTPATPPPTR